MTKSELRKAFGCSVTLLSNVPAVKETALSGAYDVLFDASLDLR